MALRTCAVTCGDKKENSRRFRRRRIRVLRAAGSYEARAYIHKGGARCAGGGPAAGGCVGTVSTGELTRSASQLYGGGPQGWKAGRSPGRRRVYLRTISRRRASLSLSLFFFYSQHKQREIVRLSCLFLSCFPRSLNS